MASPTMELPTEIIQMIIQFLRNYDLKRLRLTCKSLAEIGASSLINAVYISPREQDMAVFDSITQHPLFKHPVKHLIYDSADFSEMTRREYTDWLIDQFRGQGFDTLFEDDADYCELRSLVYGERKENGNVIRNLKAYKNHYSHPLFIKSYRQWTQMAQEQKNVHDEAWFMRVRKGLEALGPIDIAVVQNSWMVDEPGGESGQSPVARAWPCTTLQPMDYSLDPPSDGRPLPTSFDPLQFLELLHIARKRPSVINITDDLRHSVAHIVPRGLENALCSDLGERLEGLQLRLSCRGRYFSEGYYRGIQVLHKSPRLHTLTLQISTGQEYEPVHTSYFTVHFPQAIRFDHLRALHLQGYGVTYSEFSALIFDRLPKVEVLHLGDMQLMDGDWFDILEQLCDRHSLKMFGIPTVLEQPETYVGRYPVIPGLNWESPAMRFVEEHIRQYVLYGKRLDPASDKSAHQYLQRIKEWMDSDDESENSRYDWWMPDGLRAELAREYKDFGESSNFYARVAGGTR
ncbi:MAG: hypothetical protein Q9174_005331 [Haloplaca sp. 1 TL-2023]